MPNTAQQKSPEGFDLQRYVGIIRRRHLHFLVPMFLGWLAVWGSSWVLPARYKSSTLILIEQPTMPKDYVLPNVNEDLQARLQNITQQILSRTHLLHISDELNLYKKKSPPPSPEEIADQMRKDIDIELVQDAHKQVTAFRVSYTAHDPSIAQQVTNALTKLFIDENLEARQQQSVGTTKFLENQMETARKNLEEQEEKIRQFKGGHVTELPTQVASNLQILSGLQSQLQAENAALNTAKQQQVYLETLLREYQTLRGTSRDGTMDLGAIDQELDILKQKLAELRSRFTDEFTEVRALKRQIDEMEKMRDQRLVALKTKGSGTPAGVNAAAPAEENVDVKTQPQLFQLQSQLRANQAQISNHEQMIAALKPKIDEYQARLNQEPVREQQLADLSRGYDQSKATYDDLLKKKNESAMATSMELLQEGEHFRMIDPPSLPTEPSFPDRLKFCLVGLVVGLALGGGIAGGFELMDDRVYNEQELKSLLPVSVMSELPVITSAEDERAEQKKVWFGWATAGVMFATILAGSIISYLVG